MSDQLTPPVWHNPFSYIIPKTQPYTSLYQFCIHILHTLHPFKLETISVSEKNPAAKYGPNPQYNSTGTEVKLNILDFPFVSFNFEPKTNIFFIPADDYLLLPSVEHSKIFIPTSEINDFDSPYFYSNSGTSYVLPIIAIDFNKTLPILNSATDNLVIKAQYLTLMSEYLMITSDVTSSVFNQRMQEFIYKFKRFLIGFALDYLKADIFHIVQDTDSKFIANSVDLNMDILNFIS